MPRDSMHGHQFGDHSFSPITKPSMSKRADLFETLHGGSDPAWSGRFLLPTDLAWPRTRYVLRAKRWIRRFPALQHETSLLAVE